MPSIDEVYFLVRVGTWDQAALAEYINQEILVAVDDAIEQCRDADNYSFTQGETHGYDQGFKDGHHEGYEDGYAAGEARGYSDGQRDAEGSSSWGHG